MNEVCYLIEREGPLYLTARKLDGYEFHWHGDVTNAIRFVDRDQADLVMMAIRQLQSDLFPVVLPMPRPVEHIFRSKGPDWRIGKAVTPKIRTHPYFGQVGVVRRVFPETQNLKEHMEVELYAASGDPLGLDEPTDEWMTA